MYLFTHVEQQAVVNIVDTKSSHDHDRVDNQVFVAFNILKEKEKMKDGPNHNEKIEHGNKVKKMTIFLVHRREKAVKFLHKRHIYNSTYF